MYMREPFFISRQLNVAEIDGRAGAQKKTKQKRETARKRSASAAADQDFSKNRPFKKTQFSPPKNERAGWREPKKAFPGWMNVMKFNVTFW